MEMAPGRQPRQQLGVRPLWWILRVWLMDLTRRPVVRAVTSPWTPELVVVQPAETSRRLEAEPVACCQRPGATL